MQTAKGCWTSPQNYRNAARKTEKLISRVLSKNGNAGNGEMARKSQTTTTTIEAVAAAAAGSNWSCNWPNRLRLNQSEGKFFMQSPLTAASSSVSLPLFPPLSLPRSAHFFFLHFAGHSEIHLAFVAGPAAGAGAVSFFFIAPLYSGIFLFYFL